MPKQGHKWLEFNDSVVVPYQIKYLETETFGEGVGGSSPNHHNNKFRNAYILFYEREAKY